MIGNYIGNYLNEDEILMESFSIALENDESFKDGWRNSKGGLEKIKYVLKYLVEKIKKIWAAFVHWITTRKRNNKIREGINIFDIIKTKEERLKTDKSLNRDASNKLKVEIAKLKKANEEINKEGEWFKRIMVSSESNFNTIIQDLSKALKASHVKPKPGNDGYDTSSLDTIFSGINGYMQNRIIKTGESASKLKERVSEIVSELNSTDVTKSNIFSLYISHVYGNNVHDLVDSDFYNKTKENLNGLMNEFVLEISKINQGLSTSQLFMSREEINIRSVTFSKIVSIISKLLNALEHIATVLN